MARTTGPLFSMDASGTVAGAIVFSRWRGRNYVRRHAIPSNPRTPLQTGIRAAFRFLTQWWKSFGDAELGEWNAIGDVTRVTGLNAFVAANVKRLREGRTLKYNPTVETITVPDDATAGTTTPLASAMQLDWTPGTADTWLWGQGIHMMAGTAAPASIANLIAIVGPLVSQLIVTNLTPGTEYFFKIQSISTDNSYGATPAEASGIPTA